MRQIIKEPNDILHKKCELVSDFNDARQVGYELLQAIRSVSKWWNRRLGFAANQIGYLERIIALRKGKDEYEIFYNPVLIEKRIPFLYIETCYSLDSKKYYLVKRYLYSKLRYYDESGIQREKNLKGFSAIYHEIDHINGIMLSDIGFCIF